MDKKNKPKAKTKKPAALNINSAENIELTFTIGDKQYALKPKDNKLSAKICMQTVLRLALDNHEPIIIQEADIIDLSETLDEIINE